MSMATDWPDTHCVPAASCCTADHTPLPHCWNEVALMQFHSPSVAQAVPAASVDPVPVMGAGAGTTAAGAAGATSAGATSEEVLPVVPWAPVTLTAAGVAEGCATAAGEVVASETTTVVVVGGATVVMVVGVEVGAAADEDES